ncbi:MAG: hypothetical protein HY796_01555 [Elusimicrobia bacterium]|nr:hypothetical protein [Elusimicrobiota bacterium]
MANYLILLHDRTLGPVTAAEAVGLRGFTLETPVKYSDSASADWSAAGWMPELAAAFNRINEINREGENLKDSFEAMRGGWERERDLLLASWKEEADSFKATLAALKSSAEEVGKLVREHQVRFSEVRLMEERAAAHLKEPRRLAEEYKRELEKKFEGAFSQLSLLRDSRLQDWAAQLRARLDGQTEKLDEQVSAEKEKQKQLLLAWTEGFLQSLKKTLSPGQGPPGGGVPGAGEPPSGDAQKLLAGVDGLIRELRGKAGAELEKKLERDIPSVYADLRRRVEEETAAMIREFTSMAAAELADGRRALSSELKPAWEKLSCAASAEIDESLREFRRTQQAALDEEVRKFRQSLAGRVNSAGAEAGKAMDAETADLRGEISLRLGKYSAAMDGLLREMRERAGAALEKKLDGEISSVYADIRKRFDEETAGMLKGFADRSAGELEPRWEKFSALAAAEFEGSLRKFREALAEKLDAAGAETAKALEAAALEAGKAAEGETANLRGELAREAQDFSVTADRMVRELREKIATELEKRLEREIPAACADFNRSLEKEAADRLRQFTELAAGELEAGRRAVLSGLEPMWEKFSSAMTAELDDSLRDFNRKKQGALDDEVRKFRDALARELDAAALEAGKTAEGETANLRGKLTLEEKKFASAGQSLTRGHGGRQGAGSRNRGTARETDA